MTWARAASLPCLILLASCTGYATGGPRPGPVEAPPQDLVYSYLVSTERCPGWRGLMLQTEVLDEVEYFPEWVACSSTRGQPVVTYLRNDSEIPWVLHTTTDPAVPIGWDQLDYYPPQGSLVDESHAQAFVDSMSEIHHGAFVVPGGEAVVYLPPGQVAWSLDHPLAATWAAMGVVLDEVEWAGVDTAVLAAPGNSVRRVLTVCAAGLHAASGNRPARDPEEAADLLLTALTTTRATTGCAAALGRPLPLADPGGPGPGPVTTPTFEDAVADLSTTSTTIDDWAWRLGRYPRSLLTISPS